MTTMLLSFQPARAPRPWPRQTVHGLRAAFAELSPDAIEQIAHRVAQMLREDTPPPPSRLVDAEQLARHYRLSRTWVYEHADSLGAIRLGTGPRARLRFDLAEVARTLEAGAGETVRSNPAPRASARPTRRPRAGRESLLPIRDGRPARSRASNIRSVRDE